jgi:hypothetical protein
MTKTIQSGFPLLLSCGLLTGCMYTSHHFNSGRVLEPGNTAVTFGWGRLKLVERGCDYDQGFYESEDSTGRVRCVRGRFDGSPGNSSDTVAPRLAGSSLPKFSMGYRLGVRKEWGPFTGVEIGWHLEAPTNPGSAEFDLKLGLPGGGRGRFHHSASGGWIVGAWTDNSFFGEYAASRAFGPGDSAHALYASYRLTRLGTPIDEAIRSDSLVPSFGSHTRLAHQATLGFHWRLPALPVLPDFLSPQVTVSTPSVPVFGSVQPEDPVVVDLNLGFGWRF